MLRRVKQQPRHRTLAQLRTESELSQERLGQLLGTSQPAVRKTEGAADPRISTLRRYVDALGSALGVPSSLELHATIGEDRYVIDIETAAPATLGGTKGAGKQAWRLRAWDDPQIERAMIEGGFIAISADEIGDLTIEPTEEELRSRLRSAPELADRGAQAIGMFVGYWQMFRTRMQPGDVVAVPLGGRRVAIAEIVGAYGYRAGEPEPRLRHVRPVRWLNVGAPRQSLPGDLLRVVNAPGTVCSIKAPDAAVRLREAASSGASGA